MGTAGSGAPSSGSEDPVAYRANVDNRYIVYRNASDAFEAHLEFGPDEAPLRRFAETVRPGMSRDDLDDAWRRSHLNGKYPDLLERKVFRLSEKEHRWRPQAPEKDPFSGGVSNAIRDYLAGKGQKDVGAPLKPEGTPQRIGLALSGGGCKGAFTVGALKFVRQHLGCTFPVISGTSTGSLIGSLLAVNDWTALVDIYSHVRTEHIVRPYFPVFQFLGGPLLGLVAAVLRRRKAIFNTAPLQATIGANVDFRAVTAAETILIYNTTNLQTGDVVTFRNRGWSPEILEQALLASSNMPVLTDPVELTINGDRHQYVDGGVREFLPLKAIFNEKQIELDRILAISTCPLEALKQPEKLQKVTDILLRTIDLFETEIGDNDYWGARKTNALLATRRKAPEPFFREDLEKNVLRDLTEKLEGKRELEPVLIAPDEHLRMDNLTFDPADMRAAMKKGMAAARKALEKANLI